MGRTLPFWFLALLMLTALPARGAEMRTVELGVFGGFFFADSGAGVDDDLVYGVRAGYNFTPVHEMEFIYDRVDTAFASPSFGWLDETFQTYTLEWTFNFPVPRGPLVPYGFIGLSAVQDKVTRPDGGRSSDDDVFVPFGGGLRVFAGDNMAVRFEARFKPFRTFEVHQNNFELSVGLSWALGRRR